jgi:tRNA pseudouridine38-40 synthase
MKRQSYFRKGKNEKSKSGHKSKTQQLIKRSNLSRFKLLIEYDGTRYSGWQKQENARTIQGEIIKAAIQVFGNNFIDIQGSGRTDSGVHALCQSAHLDAITVFAPEVIKIKLNDLLPHDINILEAVKTNKDFHARHDAKSRSYIYQISKRRTAFSKNHVWWIKDKLNFKKMESASKLFTGLHDFSSFSDDDPLEKSTKVKIDNIQMTELENIILIRITGSHFIWKMVRRIVGILVEVGRGRRTEEEINFYLNSKSDEPAKSTAPPSGLFLENVYYEINSLIKELNPPFISAPKFKKPS